MDVSMSQREGGALYPKVPGGTTTGLPRGKTRSLIRTFRSQVSQKSNSFLLQSDLTA